MARSNISKLAEALMGRSENEGEDKISLAVSGLLLMITGVVPKLNAMSLVQPIEFAMRASFRWAKEPIWGSVPNKGQPEGPLSLGTEFRL